MITARRNNVTPYKWARLFFRARAAISPGSVKTIW